jgi:C4-dicarboxylate-specific signal transduction histidine kinase
MINLEDILLDAPTPIAWIDAKMNFIGANNMFIQILNLKTSKSLKGRAFSDLFESMEKLSLVERFIKFDEQNLSYDQNILVGRKIHNFKITLKKFLNPNLIIAMYAEDQTILNEKQQELDVLKSSSMAAARMAVIGEMTSGIAHEINNPLAVISGLADQIIRNIPEDEQEKHGVNTKIIKIKQMTERVHKIVKGLKTQSRDGNSDPFETNFVKELINDSIAICTDNLKSLNINLICDDIDPRIKLDCRGTQISQVILNLISNSRDAVKHQSKDRWIRVSAKDTGNFIQFTMSDSGTGIPAEIREKMLQPFFTTKAAGEGTGLGLSITKNIIESHCGIFCIDENVKNTTFVFSIPKGLSTQMPTEV